MAWAYVSVRDRRATGPGRGDDDGQRGLVGVWRGPRELDRLLDLVFDLLLGLLELSLWISAVEQSLASLGDRVAGLPLLQLIFSLHAHVHVPSRADVPSPSIRPAFEERRPVATPRSRHRVGRRLMDRDGVVAVEPGSGNAMRPSRFDDIVFRAAFEELQVAGVEVVLADEDHGEAVEGGEVEGFVKVTLLRCAVAEEGDGHPPVAPQLRGERRADGERDRGGDERHRAEEANLRRDQMHRAATAPGAPGRFAIQLGHHRGEVAALGQVVPMRAMATPDVVVPAERGADAGGDRFLADVEMARRLDLARLYQVRHALFESPDLAHAAIRLEQQLACSLGLLTSHGRFARCAFVHAGWSFIRSRA